FAVFSDPAYAYLFDSPELEVIRKRIPWTRYVTTSRTVFHGSAFDLTTLILKEQERFVLKPNDDYGGQGVFLGWESDKQAWQDAVKAALEKPYVVQERVDFEKTKIPAYSDQIYLDEL